jgi:membrane protease YdiL (CAAX protease family)
MSGKTVFPGPLDAVMLTLTALFAMALIVAIFAAPTEVPSGVALGLGLVVGFGVTGTLAARRVPAPQPARLGLRGCSPGFVAVVLLLTPSALLASELDNLCRVLLPPADAAEVTARVAERLSQQTPLDILETWVLTVGLVPVIEEWFFRGVVQQGLVARFGSIAGLATTALLFGVAHAMPGGASAGSLLAMASSASLLGAMFGVARLASGSLLPAIGLHAAVNALGLAGIDLVDRVPIAGFNAPGDHTPTAWLAGAAISTGIGLLISRALAARVPPQAEAPGEES